MLTDWQAAVQAYGSFGTVALAVLALAAVIFAWKTINSSKEQKRIDILLRLIERISTKEARDSRGLVYGLWQQWSHPDDYPEALGEGQRIAKLIDDATSLEISVAENTPVRQIKNSQKRAIEDTVSTLDMIGFFLLDHPKVGEKIAAEAPDYIWEIADNMWGRLGEYVEGVQTGSLERRFEQAERPEYGKYFQKLAKRAKKELHRK